uniref:Uncharacterized protein n=1 Tax=Acrobeloides nanus TaxID=290746 RepID=A0A914E4Y8_9BILA
MCQYGGYGAQKTEYSPVIPPSDDPYYTPPDIPHPLREERKPEAIRSHHAPVAPAAPSNKSSGPNLPIHLPSSITSSQS